MYDDSDAISLRVQRLKKDPSVEAHWGFIFQMVFSEILIYSIN